MPIHNWECPKGHQFESEGEWNVEKIPCTHVECHQKAERIWLAPRSPHRQLATPVVFWRYSDGSVGVAGGTNSKTPPNAERLEVRSLGEVREITKKINERLRSAENRREEGFRKVRESMEHVSRSNLSYMMGQESDPVAKEIYREALERNKGGHEPIPFTEFYSEVAELDASNREGGRGQRK
jgi:hypothetical protein